MPLRAYSRRPPRQSCSLARRETDARPFARATLQLSGPGRAPVKFPTPFQWRTSISFREPLLIDQYLPALGIHQSVWHVRPSLPPPSTPLAVCRVFTIVPSVPNLGAGALMPAP
jgi:hypothetical protein